MPTEAKLIAVLLLLAAITGAAFLYTEHERAIGEAKIEAQDKAADAKIASQVAAQTAELKAKADMADKGAQDAQQKLNDYMGSISSAPVRVCHQNESGSGLPKAAAAHGAAPSAGTGPEVSGQVPTGSISAGADISPELDAIMRSFGYLAIQVSDFQQR
jgi:hypothetical protein